MKIKSIILLIVALVASVAVCAQNNARMLTTPNAQTGTTYTFVAVDTTRVTTFSNAGAVAVTLPNGATIGFGAGTMLSAVNLGAGQVTITCSSCTINGAATLVLAQNQGADIYGGSGNSAVNYIAVQSPSGANFALLNGTNVFTGNNSHSGTETFTGPQTVGKWNGNCVVDGTANATLAAAVTCAGSSGVIEIPMFAVPTLTASVTIPVGVTLKFDGPSGITTTGWTLTINGPLIAPQGTQIFFGTGTVTLGEGVGPVRPLWWPGADIGAQQNAMYASMPANGGIAYLDSNPAGGCWSYTTPIVWATSNKYVTEIGVDPSTSNPITGACLRYTPTTATIAWKLDWTPVGGGGYAPGSGLRDITLVNGASDCSTVGGCGSSAIGIQLGGANGGTHKALYQNVKVVGFSNNWKVVNDTVGWGVVWLNSTNSFCNIGINYTTTHENDTFDGGAINSCAQGVVLNGGASGGEFRAVKSSFDANSTCAIQITQDFTSVSISDSHFENTVTTNPTAYVCGSTTSSRLSVKNTVMMDLTSGGTSNQVWVQAGLINADIQFNSGVGGRVQNVSPVVANTSGVVSAVVNPAMAFPTINRGQAGNIDITVKNGAASIYSPIVGLSERARPGADATLVNAGIGPCYEDSTTHIGTCNPNNSGWIATIPQKFFLTSIYTNASTTFSTVAFTPALPSILANDNFLLRCDLAYSTSASTAGPKFQVTGPSTPTAVLFSVDGGTAAAAYADATVTNFSTANTALNTSGANGVNFVAHLMLSVVNGANSGAIALQAAANGAGTLTIPAGAVCTLQ